MMTKNEVRSTMRGSRDKLTDEEIASRSRAITDKLIKSDIFANAADVFIYISYNHEVDTFGLLKQCLDLGKRVYAPRVINKTDMEFYRLRSVDNLEPGYMGIPEPKKGLESADSFDGLIIMPGLAFDTDYNRIGYGGGYYDRYLSDGSYPDRSELTKVAVCFDFQLLESIPHEEHDLKPDVIITDKRIMRRK